MDVWLRQPSGPPSAEFPWSAGAVCLVSVSAARVGGLPEMVALGARLSLSSGLAGPGMAAGGVPSGAARHNFSNYLSLF